VHRSVPQLPQLTIANSQYANKKSGEGIKNYRSFSGNHKTVLDED